jgi:hypothetical protein
VGDDVGELDEVFGHRRYPASLRAVKIWLVTG